MTLLTEMLERPLDPGYAAAAQRRRERGMPRHRPLGTAWVALGTILIGLVVTVAAQRFSGTATPADAARADLVARVEAKQSAIDELTATVVGLEAEVRTLQSDKGGDGEALARADALSVTAGAVPMEGPGLQITVDDAPEAGTTGAAAPRDDAAPNQGRVYARDLQIVTNALWRSGAEAISINGHRLTTTSAIRFAGAALLVDYRPLARPYVITAIGAPGTFVTAFVDGDGGSYLATLHASFNISVDVAAQKSLVVPAAVPRTTRYAVPVDNGAGKDDT